MGDIANGTVEAIGNGAAPRPGVRVERRGTALRVTLDRPPVNALSRVMIAELAAAVELAKSDPNVRVVALRATGKVFSAGHDLKEISAHRGDADGGREFFETLMRECAELMVAIVRCPKPVVAIVEGLATAAGCQLVASCDLAIGTDKATFATPGVNIGLFCSTPMVALSRNVHRKQAMEMLLTGERIDASQAKAFGLLNRVVPEEYLEVVAEKYLTEIARKPARVLKIGKEAFYRQLEMPLDDAYAYAGEVMVRNLLATDAIEGIDAFTGKREARWADPE